MRYFTTLAFISASLFSFAQSNMFWNNYSNFNPAMTGFNYQQHGSITYTDFYPALSGNYSDIHANYNYRLKKHGFGVNYTGKFAPIVLSNKGILNYSYQQALTRKSQISGGIGIGVGNERLRHDDFYTIDTTLYADPVTSFQLNVGVAYRWKLLTIGFAATNLLPPAPSTGYGYFFETVPTYRAHAKYDFKFSDKFMLTPQILFSSYDGFRRVQTNLTMMYKQQFAVGILADFRDNYGINLGWDIKEKFRVAYSYSQTFSKLNNASNGGIHEISLGYFMNQKTPKISGTPNF